MSQPLLVPFNYAGQFSILERIMSSNPLHPTMRMISSQYRGPTLLHFHSELTAQSVINGKMWT